MWTFNHFWEITWILESYRGRSYYMHSCMRSAMDAIPDVPDTHLEYSATKMCSSDTYRQYSQHGKPKVLAISLQTHRERHLQDQQNCWTKPHRCDCRTVETFRRLQRLSRRPLRSEVSCASPVVFNSSSWTTKTRASLWESGRAAASARTTVRIQ